MYNLRRFRVRYWMQDGSAVHRKHGDQRAQLVLLRRAGADRNKFVPTKAASPAVPPSTAPINLIIGTILIIKQKIALARRRGKCNFNQSKKAKQNKTK